MSDKPKKTAKGSEELVEYRKDTMSVSYPKAFAERNDAHLRADHWYPVEKIESKLKEEPTGEEPATQTD